MSKRKPLFSEAEELRLAEHLFTETDQALSAFIEKFRFSETDSSNPYVVLRTKIRLWMGRQEIRRRNRK